MPYRTSEKEVSDFLQERYDLPVMKIICGPTAVGKTGFAIELAQRFGAEIISVDSGQVYRGMDIGTAKPSKEVRSTIRFHLLDLIDPSEKFSAKAFEELARAAIEDVRARGKEIILVGGTGLYFKALEGGLFEGPEADPVIRRSLEMEIQKKGLPSLHEELKGIDPEAAQVIPAGNRQRLIRALEVYRKTGRPISEFWRRHGFQEKRYQFQKLGLRLPPEVLKNRIEERVDEMVRQGLLDEVRDLVRMWGEDAPGLQLIGYKEIVDSLAGRSSLETALALIKKNTWQYARRQMTWFRRDPEIVWEDAREA